ncbi:MAG: GTPase ObgE [Clostridia bacterium]|jgi:GTP-binding protein|nr:GTPase ObgE [Clostridia bacterium]MDD4275972.1 GTPase ObgE [Clostridia bacterium]
MFVDKVKIVIKAGNGGNGVVSFIRSKATMKGGPDGGNGGKGGDIVFVANESMNTLVDFNYNKSFKAEDGENGSSNNQIGKSGKDTIINVPRGTIIRDYKTEKVIADMYEKDQRTVILHGGSGGRGNKTYATSTRQAPFFSQGGAITKPFEVVLELKTIADVGLVGYPNVGKSTLLSVVTEAKPKIANYHFTTLSPNLGVVKYYENSFVMADIPGLIDGASKGAGLGHDFLRHIERTRLIVHIIDIAGSEERDPFDDYLQINKELSTYSRKLADSPQIIALNKCDLLQDDKPIKDFKKKLDRGIEAYPISGATMQGVKELLDAIWNKLKTIPVSEPLAIEKENIDERDLLNFIITKNGQGAYVVSGGKIDEMARGIVLSDTQSFAYLQNRLRREGITQMLYDMGAKNGDTIIVAGVEFELVK